MHARQSKRKEILPNDFGHHRSLAVDGHPTNLRESFDLSDTTREDAGIVFLAKLPDV